MSSKHLTRALSGVAICVFYFGSAHCAFAQNATPDQEYSRYLTKAQAITPISSFGDQVSPRDGALSFRQVDVELPGIGPTIRIVRKFRVAGRMGKIAETSGNRMGEWELVLPSLKTITSAKTFGVSRTSPKGWQVGQASDARCTNIGSPGTIFPNKTDPVEPETWWAGYQLVEESGEEENVLGHGQTGSQPTHVARTKGNWLIACLSSTSNGLSGEAFQAISPDGTRYRLDYLVYQGAPGVGESGPGFLSRNYASMLVTRVEDRFGNWITYHYTNGIVDVIEASDGRRVTLTNDGTNISSIKVASASGDRTWQYSYNGNSLASVVLPDGSSWKFSLGVLFSLAVPLQNKWGNCSATTSGATTNDDGLTGAETSGSITSPAGSIATFSVRTLHIGRSYTPKACWSVAAGSGLYAEYPKDSWEYAISSKVVTGPGLSQATWQYSYSPGNSSFSSDCANGCTSTVWTDVVEPDGKRQRNVFSNRVDGTENLLLRTEIHAAGSDALVRAIDYSYAITPTVESNSPYPWRSAGGDFGQRTNRYMTERWTPSLSTKVTKESAEFTNTVNSYDVYARPLSVTRSSPWNNRTDVVEYYDNFAKWILGAEASSTNTATNLVERQASYNENGQPITIKAFGKLQQTLTYNSDGTLAAVKDGNGNAITLSSWRRGLPQSISYADGTTQSATINDNGWITAVVDQNGYVTNYGYDPMGRINSISYPNGDSSAWNGTTRVFEQVASAEYGIPAGHWRQTVATGNARKLTYFDAQWRPLVTREYDAGNEGGTQRFQRFGYDYDGQNTFSSYPGSSDALSTGVWTSYDALGRKTSVSQDSELGSLTTLIEYLPGNQTRVTDPRGNKTLTGYQVFDQPDYKAPVWIQHPEGATTEISRDVFGKPTSIRRHDASGGVSLTRSYVYDGYQQLCKTIEPETGASANGYDAAGNIVWTASGLSLPSTTACDADAAFAAGRRVDRSYDARNRITALTFPDGNGNQRWTYWPDGLVKQINTVNNAISTYNSYAYNKRRLLVGESQGQADGETWAIGYGYNANGHLVAHRYPSGQTIDYAPNALGQPTQAGSYATGVSYYPNGAIKQFTYGNGIVHTLTQNARQLPDTSQDAYGGIAFLSDGYDYDANGNVAGISDGATGRNQRGNRTMSYDGLDRLTSAQSPMFGTATYGYDVLDNLTHVVAPGRDHYYCYDGYWQLTNVKTGNCSGSTVIGMSYDIQGNLKNKNGQGFVFDYGNRLREATGKETYRYDGYGRRTLAMQSGGAIGSMYDQAGALRYQKNQRQAKATDYIMLGGSLVAEADWAFGQSMSVKDYVNWTAVDDATRYVVEESVDGVTWTSVYDGADPSWTSLARPSGNYAYRVSACKPDGTCSAAANVAHTQQPAFDIAPILYQLLLN